MKENEFECWIDVPGTDMRFQVSNRGNLRVIAKRQIRGRRCVRVSVCELRRPVCDYKSGKIGWWLFFDGAKHFFTRDELVGNFPEEFRNVDRSKDEEMRKLRDETFRDLDAEWAMKREGAERTDDDAS